MIVPKLWARLGNQCFMIAAAIAHAKKMNTKWAVPSKTLDPRAWPTYFKLPVKPNTNSPFHTYKEPKHSYNPLPEKQDMWIEGYFQSEKYFIGAKEEIGNALGFHCKKEDYIAIHVRRGDYLQYQDQFQVLNKEYYKEAIHYLVSLTGIGRFRIYSDDIRWCKENIKPDIINWMQYDNIPSYEYSEIKDPLTDMRDMYNAAGFIISNSTFSLFPALLRLDNPITIAPLEDKWYGLKNKHLETCDLMPERFFKI